jgi:hypothetical protein
VKLSIGQKYLKNYAEPETAQLLSSLTFFNHKHYQHSLVIPAYQETCQFIQQFIESVISDQSVLLIVIINQPDTDSDITLQQCLFDQIICLGESSKLDEQLTYVTLNNSKSDMLIVDRFNTPIPEKQGVGLARKIGCDLALALIEHNIITSHFIASSDADASLPDDYFTVQKNIAMVNKANHISAICFNFYHNSDDQQVHQANALYEQALRYYVAGLHYAGSPYAFFTIGSILVFNAHSYAQVRGFPKRSAGEDFYLMNKLAKIGEVKFVANSHIKLLARRSERVPFGTGPAVNKIIALTESKQAYCYYHPQVFTELKVLLQASQCLWLALNDLTFSSQWLAKLSAISQQALIDIGFHSFVEKHKNDKQPQFDKQFIVWFDAFKTLKYIHALRDLSLADIELQQAIKQAKFTS